MAMDRKELRFRILFEYYRDLHSGDRNARGGIKAINADHAEKRAAMIWLIDEGHVKGQVIAQVGIPMPSIGRISSHGINFVESVMAGAFTEIRGMDGGFDSLSKTDKIRRFVAECLGNPATGALCSATYEAITALMK